MKRGPPRLSPPRTTKKRQLGNKRSTHSMQIVNTKLALDFLFIFSWMNDKLH